jgi:hypothetical protein
MLSRQIEDGAPIGQHGSRGADAVGNLFGALEAEFFFAVFCAR